MQASAVHTYIYACTSTSVLLMHHKLSRSYIMQCILHSMYELRSHLRTYDADQIQIICMSSDK